MCLGWKTILPKFLIGRNWHWRKLWNLLRKDVTNSKRSIRNTLKQNLRRSLSLWSLICLMISPKTFLREWKHGFSRSLIPSALMTLNTRTCSQLMNSITGRSKNLTWKREKSFKWRYKGKSWRTSELRLPNLKCLNMIWEMSTTKTSAFQNMRTRLKVGQ